MFSVATALTLLISVSLLMVNTSAISLEEFQADFRKVESSINKKIKSEGLLLEAPPSYVNFKGSDGLQLEISFPSVGPFDYTLMFWFRSNQSYKELLNDESIQGGKKAYLFEIPGLGTNKVYKSADDISGVACYITNPGAGPVLSCSTDDDNEQDFKIDLIDLPDMQQWMHLTYSSNYDAVSQQAFDKKGLRGQSFVRIDVSNKSFTAYLDRHKPIEIEPDKSQSRGFCFYGGGWGGQKGFPGDYRQFWMTLGYLKDQESIKLLQHQYKVMDYSTMAYYKFETTVLYDQYDDAFRYQRALTNQTAPIFYSENIAAPFCNSIPQKFEQVPQFYKSAGDKMKDIDIPRFFFKGRDIGYTLSFWLKNFGQHSYSTNPREGRELHHMIKIDECFAIWYDSKTSFRVYIYAKNNYEELYSSSVFLPLYEWVNIQVAFSQQDGIVIMTFNQNGDKQQTVWNQAYLAEQYPRGKMHLFQEFVGLPYQLNIWERKIQLPIDFKAGDIEEGKVVAYNFMKNYYVPYQVDGVQLNGWQSLQSNGQNIAAAEGEGFDFIFANVPSDVDFNLGNDQQYIGQRQAKATDWNDVTCPSPTNNQMYLGFQQVDGQQDQIESTSKSRKGAKFTKSILVDQTAEYTVEFWFKAHTESATEIQSANNIEIENQDGLVTGIDKRTFLFGMEDQGGKRAMDIYVEDGTLKCAPFGNYLDDKKILSYDIGSNPLETSEWQHITCIFINELYVKGQYLKIDMDPDVADNSFPDKILRPSTFSKSVKLDDVDNPNANLYQQRRWTVTLGDENPLKEFAGSFKDVRVWKSARTDAELVSKRFNQIKYDANLAGNFKFMDGNPYIFNSADSNVEGIEFATIESRMILGKSDLTNLICASDTYFDPFEQKCTRYPYAEDGVQIVYYVTNNVQHGHYLVLFSMIYSPMFLPGKYQPKVRALWSVVPDDDISNTAADAVRDKYFSENNEQNFYAFDPIFMGDFVEYKFQLEINDQVEHNFFATVQQDIRSRKCIQVIDLDQGLTDSQDFVKALILEENAEDQEDLVMSFKVERISGCKDEKDNTLQGQGKVSITSQPPLPSTILDQIQQEFNFEEQSFKITLPGAVQHAEEMIKNVPINMILNLFWSIDDGSEQFAQMNILYLVTLATKIDLQLERLDLVGDGQQLQADQTYVVNIKKDDLIISASKSNFAGLSGESGYAGLAFRWECTSSDEGSDLFESLNEYCQRWNGSSVLQIPNSMIEESWVDKPIIIKVMASSIETSEINGYLIKQEFAAKFTWVQTNQAKFELKTPNTCNDDDLCLLLVSVDQDISVKPLGGWNPVGNSGYRFDYKVYYDTGDDELNCDTVYEEIVEEESDEAADSEEAESNEADVEEVETVPRGPIEDLSQLDSESTIFRISKEKLTENTKYKLTVKAYNELNDFIEDFCVVKTLYTGTKPTIQTLSIEPSTGFVYDTEFTITLSDYTPNVDDMTYLLYGVIQDDDNQTLKISTGPQKVTEPTTQKLPEIVKIIAILTDQNGEIVEIQQDVKVEKPADASWLEIVDTQQKQESSDAVLWLSFQSIGAQANQAAKVSGSEQDKQDAFDVNQVIAEKAFEDILKIPKDWTKIEGTAEEYDTIVNYVVLTIGKVSTYSEFVTSDTLQKFTESLEQILRINQVIESINDDVDQRRDYANAIGNLMSQLSLKSNVELVQSAQTDQLDIVWNNRRLQDEEPTSQVIPETRAPEELQDLRDLMRKLVVVKNSYLDILCNDDDLFESAVDGEEVKIQADSIDFVVVRHMLNADHENDLILESQDQTVSMSIPADEVLQRTGKDSGANWVCYQATFSKANPVAGILVDDQYYVEDLQFIQIGTLDNLGRRLVDQDGIQELVNTFKVRFSHGLDSDPFFYEGQTTCAHYDGNSDTFGDEKWSTTDCSYEYLFKENQILCQCTSFNNYYYSIITDRQRELDQPPVYQEETHYVLLAVGIPLILIGFAMPIAMIFLDSNDYQKVEDNYFEVNDLMVSQIQKARNYQCKQEIYYREKEISKYRKLKDFRKGSFSAFWVFMRTLHPYVSLFTYFDYRMKRLTRFCFVLGQISIITLLLWISYSKWVEDWKIMDDMGENRPFYISLILSITMVPLPRVCCCFFKTEMYIFQVDKDDDDDSDDEKKQLNQNDETDVAEDDPDAKLGKKGNSPTNANGEEKKYETRPALFDYFVQLKCILILSIFLLWIFTIFVMYFFGESSGSDSDFNDGYWYTFVELTADEAKEFVMCWYLTIFVFGTLINCLRVGLFALIVPAIAQDSFEQNGAQCYRRCCVIFFIPSESVEIALDVLHTIAIEKDGLNLEKHQVMEEDNESFQVLVKRFKQSSLYKSVEMSKMNTAKSTQYFQTPKSPAETGKPKKSKQKNSSRKNGKKQKDKKKTKD